VGDDEMESSEKEDVEGKDDLSFEILFPSFLLKFYIFNLYIFLANTSY